jgi:hypothetical protein
MAWGCLDPALVIRVAPAACSIMSVPGMLAVPDLFPAVAV